MGLFSKVLINLTSIDKSFILTACTLSIEIMKISISDVGRAVDAAEWCKRNKINYNLECHGWPGPTIYKFEFQKEFDMMIFSLKWT